MKIGCETIIFGRNIDNLDWVLGNIANLGYTGVEIYQHPDRIHVYDRDLARFRKATIEDIVIGLRRYDLDFLGMASGTLRDRIDYCNAIDVDARDKHNITQADCTPLYMYSEELDDSETVAALAEGITIGFHPHAFTRYERVLKAMPDFDDANPHLFWLPDTAHMAVAGEDPVSVLGQIPVNKVIAVHLKGYDRAYGRAYHRYARGFDSLNDHDPALLRSIQTLERRGYQGWYVVEQDFSHSAAFESLAHSAEWLRKHGFLPGASSPKHVLDELPQDEQQGLSGELANRLCRFTSSIYRAAESRLPACYTALAKSVMELTSANHISLWSWNPTRNDVCLLASYPQELQSADEPWRVDIRTSPLRHAQHPMQAVETPISSLGADGTVFTYKRLADITKSNYAFVMAIPNRYNPHALRMLIGGMTTAPASCDYSELAEYIADDIGRAANAALDDACALAAADVNIASDQTSDTATFLNLMAARIRHHVQCEAVSIFLVGRPSNRLVCRHGAQIKWRDNVPENDRCYFTTEVEHYTVTCWQECRTILIADAVQEMYAGDSTKPKSREAVPGESEGHDNILIVPLVAVTNDGEGGSTADAIGVIRCRNKRTVVSNGQVHRPFFTDDDAAILSAMCQAAVPHIDTLLRDELVTANLASLTHELIMPVNTLQAAVDEVQYLLNARDYSQLQDLAEDMVSWTGLMTRIIQMADLFGKKAEPLEPQCERVGLFGDVIAPLKPLMSKLLANRGFSVDQIEYDRFDSIPKMYLDRNQFQMVFFNLFSNAIKYAYQDPRRFRIRIDAETGHGRILVHFRDWGPGIPEDSIQSIFEPGIRGPASLNKLVKGMGLGLWVVRRVVEAHEGTVGVTNLHDPTSITIALPDARRSSPPPRSRKGN